MKYGEKLEVLKNIRQDIKRKRVRFDESRDNFGFDKLKLLSKVKNTSEVKGYPFKCYNLKEGSFKYALKVVPIEKKFDKYKNPSKLEIEILKKLSEDLINGGVTPNVVYYLTNLKVVNRCDALKCIDLKRLEAEDKIRKNSYVLVSEYLEGGSLYDWSYNRYDEKKDVTSREWCEIIFQILYTILVFQNKYKGNHNDTHYGNVLMDTSIEAGGYYVYELEDLDGVVIVYYIKNRGVLPKLWDFEFAMIYSNEIEVFPNQFVIGDLNYDSKEHKTIENYSDPEERFEYSVPVQYNEIYDPHFFICSLLELKLPEDIIDWIYDTYPEEVIPEESESESYTDSFISSKYTDSQILERESESESERESGSQSESERESERSESESESESVGFLDDGRLVNGKTEHLNLPTSLTLLKSKFFECLRIKPLDFDSKECVVFRYKMKKWV